MPDAAGRPSPDPAPDEDRSEPSPWEKEKARLERRVHQLQAQVNRLQKVQTDFAETLMKMDLIPRLAQELNSLDQEKIAQVCLERIPMFLQAQVSSLYLYQPESDELQLLDSKPPRPIPKRIALAEAKDTLMEYAIRKRELLIIPDAAEFADKERLRLPFREEYTSQTCIVAPLLAGNQVIGVLNYAERVKGPFNQMEDLGFVGPLVQMIGVSISNIQLHDQVALQAKLDTMTGLLRHKTFFEESEGEIERADRYGKPLSLVMVDIDDFKHFNDTFGHQAGDVVIIDTARIIKQQVRKTDVPGRYGGDEFAILLPETDISGAFLTAMRIRNKIKAHKYIWEGKELNVCISVGVCQWAKGMGVQELIELGDEGLYKSKRAGKDQVQAVGEAAKKLAAV